MLCIAAGSQAQAWEWTYQGKTTSQWIEALKSNDAGLRFTAAWALGEIGEHAVAAVPALIEAFKDEHRNVRWNSLEAVGKIGPGATAAIPALTEILKHPEDTMRWRAAWALGGIGPTAASAVPSLTELLTDESGDVRMNAAQALGKIGPAAASAAAGLAKALADEDWQVRMYAATALAQIGPAANTAVPALTAALNDDNDAVRAQVAAALKAIGPAPPPTGSQTAQPQQPPAEQPTGPPPEAIQSPGLRREAMLMLVPDSPASGNITLNSQTMHHYVTPLSFELSDEENRLLQEGIVGLGSERQFSLPVYAAGPCLLRLDSGLNRYVVTTDIPHCYLASEAHWLRVNQFAGDLYFFVPAACEQFEVRAWCESPMEGAAIQVISPQGAVAAQAAGEIAQWEALKVQPAPELCGKPWRINIAKDETTILDDVDIYLTGDLTPLVSMKPDWVATMVPALGAPDTGAE